MDKINTCISLFFGYNEFERAVEERRKQNVRINTLNPEDLKKYQKNCLKESFSEGEKQTLWYKMIQENNNVYRPSNDKMIKMIISLCALIIALNKEELINKNKKEFDVFVSQSDFDITIYNWVKKKNGKLYIGDIEFENTAECLQFVRNKLIHGDYFIKNQYIILKNNGKFGKIHYENLLISCCNLTGLSKCKNKCIERTMFLYQKNHEIRKNNKIYSDEIYEVKLKIKIRGKREISINVLNIIANIEDSIFEYNINKKFPIAKAIDLALKEYESDIAKYHLDIDYDTKSFSEKKLDEVKNKFNEVIEYMKKNYRSDNPTLQEIFQYFNLNNYNDSKEYFNDNFCAIIFFLKGSLKRNWALSPDFTDQLAIAYRNFYSALDILKFYCYFNYGLDNILFSSEEISLKSIFNNKYFDYSKLDLSLFDDPNMRCDITFGSYEEQLQSIYSEYEKSKKAYLSKKEIYDKYIEKYGHNNSIVEQKIKAKHNILCFALKISFSTVRARKRAQKA